MLHSTSNLIKALPPYLPYDPLAMAQQSTGESMAAINPEPWLQALDRDPTVFKAIVNRNHNNRLGVMFENLVEYWLQSGPLPAEVCQRGVTVMDPTGKVTLGELDFVFDRNGLRAHLEVFVKFYLGLEVRAGGHVAWMGANPRDRLDIKLKRVCTHQLALSATLDEHRGRRQLFLAKGLLMQHWRDRVAWPVEVGIRPQANFWCSVSELAGGQVAPALSGAGERWLPLVKSRYLGAHHAPWAAARAQQLEVFSEHAAEGQEAFSRFCWDTLALAESQRRYAAAHGAIVLSRVDAEGCERGRLMVVGDHWRAAARACADP